MHASKKEFSEACVLLGAGADYASTSHSQYTTLLFLLSKGMVCIFLTYKIFKCTSQ